MLNKCQFIGNVGKDPEIKTFDSGNKVSNFNLAVSERWTDKKTGEKKEKTEWIKVSVFNEGLVGVIDKYVKKGSKLYVEGQFQTREWTGTDGIRKFSTEIVLQGFNGNIILLDGVPKAESAHSVAKADGYAPQPPDPIDEIPF